MTATPRPPRPATDGALTRGDRIVLTVLALVLVAGWIHAALAPLPELLYRISDDAFYYFTVARNVVSGHGLTFDRINDTNGFHPLWLIVLLPVFAAVPNDPDLAMRAISGLVVLVAVVTAWVAYRALIRLVGRAAALVGLLAMLSPLLLNPLLCGLETGLMMLLLYAFFLACDRFDLLSTHAGTARDLGLGALMALLFLCRLDTVFIGIGIAILLIARGVAGTAGERAAMARKLAIVGVAVSLPVGAYLAWNRVRFGHLMPISGTLKTTFPHVSFTTWELGLFDTLLGEAQLAFAAVVLLLAWFRPGWFAGPGARHGSSGWLAVYAALIGAGLHFLNRILFMSWGVYWWHFASYGPVALVAGALLVRGIVAARPRLTPVLAVAVAVVVLIGFGFDARHRGRQHVVWLEAALWAREHLPADAVIGMTDCGMFGYFSQRRTMNLDGVINSFAYQEAVRGRRLTAFLARARVTHFGYHAVRYRDGTFRSLIIVHGEWPRTYAAIVTTPDAEIYRSAPYEQGQFMLWNAGEVRVVNDVRELSAGAAAPR